MLINLKNNLHWLIYLISLLASICCFLDGMLIMGIIFLLSGVYGWLITSLICERYKLKDFIYTVCGSGTLLAIVFFFINGVEQVAFPEGAILFKEEGIAQALFLFFIFTIPVIIYHHGTTVLTTAHPKTADVLKQQNKQTTEIDEDWETATIEDIESGNYEPI